MKTPKWTVFKIFARHKMCLRANLLLLELRYACSRIQILVLAKYFGDFIPSPRNFAPWPTKLKNRPNGRFLKFRRSQSTSGILSPRLATSPLCPTKLKKRPFGRFLKFWCEQRGSNPRPQPWQGCALAN